MQLQVRVAMHCDRQRHASSALAYLSEPTVIACTMSLDGYHTYTSLLVLLSLTMHITYTRRLCSTTICYVNDSCWSC